jgi:putative CocE/NonD family hydrolase
MRTLGPTKVRDSQEMIVGPWVHRSAATLQPDPRQGDVDFGPDSVLNLREIILRWLNHYIKGIDNGIDRELPVRAFTMGENAWHSYADWPVPGTQYIDYYLQSSGSANTLNGDGILITAAPLSQGKADFFVYDPANPVPTVGGNLCCSPEILPWGPMDQRAVERRDDVLVYTTAPLSKDLRITGPVEMKLWVASSARDTDFTVKLTDVYPNGLVMNLTDGILRTRYRNSFQRPELLEPEKPYELTVDLWNTSNLFKKDHRIRVEISSSNFPHYSRNTNLARQPETDTTWELAHQSIFHDANHPSRIILPVLEP